MDVGNQGMQLRVSRAAKVRLIRAAGKRCQGYGDGFKGNVHKLVSSRVGFELDHKTPAARGGSDAESNLPILCLPCHVGKTNEDGRGGLARNMTDAEWQHAGKPQDWRRRNGMSGR